MNPKLRIGTRTSALAIWQSEKIQFQLSQIGIESELVPIKSHGEIFTETPLYELGVQGIFTKTLDAALLDNRIDLAVYSFKDVPTQMAQGLIVAAVTKRDSPMDVLIHKKPFLENESAFLIATSSLRRKAQWLHRFPSHEINVLRGNINTRLQKLTENEAWGGAIFAAAGLDRMKINVPYRTELDWMIPAPAQGALCIVTRKSNESFIQELSQLNDSETLLSTQVERFFLRKTMGGCSMPIGALCTVHHQEIRLTACILTVDGKKMKKVEMEGSIHEPEQLVENVFQLIRRNGGDEILSSFHHKP
jgi:hydroxymethylbilane synthase